MLGAVGRTYRLPSPPREMPPLPRGRAVRAGGGRLFLFVEPTPPQGQDLRRYGRYTMHWAVGSPEEEGDEFLVFAPGRSKA